MTAAAEIDDQSTSSALVVPRPRQRAVNGTSKMGGSEPLQGRVGPDRRRRPAPRADHSSPFLGWRSLAACPEKSVGSEPWMTGQNFREAHDEQAGSPDVLFVPNQAVRGVLDDR
jgi:hypothetical protein